MKRSTNSKTHFYYISLLNVLSALAVVLLHANGAFWGYREGRNWAINNIIESVFYYAVPIFFMLTGATLIDYKERYDTKTFFKRRFSKILIPFAFWSIFGVFYYAVIQQHGWDLNASKAFNALFSGSYVSIFWFFPPLICIYLALPLFSSIKGDKKPLLRYLAIIGLVINIVIPFLIKAANYSLSTDLKWPYSISVIGGHLIYPIVGYLLHNSELSKRSRISIYILAIVSLAAHILGTYFLSRRAGAIVDLFKGYLNVPCFFYSIGIFVFIKQLCNSKKFTSLTEKPVLFLHKYTFALYLIHCFVLDSVGRKLNEFEIYGHQLRYIALAFSFTVPICIMLIFLIRKIPKVGKHLLP